MIQNAFVVDVCSVKASSDSSQSEEGGNAKQWLILYVLPLRAVEGYLMSHESFVSLSSYQPNPKNALQLVHHRDSCEKGILAIILGAFETKR